MSNNRLQLNKEFYITVSMIVGVLSLSVITVISVLTVFFKIYLEKPVSTNGSPIDTKVVNDAVNLLNQN